MAFCLSGLLGRMNACSPAAMSAKVVQAQENGKGRPVFFQVFNDKCLRKCTRNNRLHARRGGKCAPSFSISRPMWPLPLPAGTVLSMLPIRSA